jgi:hypothetical protein
VNISPTSGPAVLRSIFYDYRITSTVRSAYDILLQGGPKAFPGILQAGWQKIQDAGAQHNSLRSQLRAPVALQQSPIVVIKLNADPLNSFFAGSIFENITSK